MQLFMEGFTVLLEESNASVSYELHISDEHKKFQGSNLALVNLQNVSALNVLEFFASAR